MTIKRTARCFAVLLTLTAASACERAKSANPLSPDVAGPIPGVNITAPAPLEPGVGSQVIQTGAPQTLVLGNATTSGVRVLWMQLEVASDTAFQQVVHKADRLALDAAGRTSYRLPTPLGPGQTYYWRARALDGANTGPYSAVAHFSVVEPVVIEAPTPLEPIGTLTTNRPEFRARNGRISGTTGVIYRFEVATAPDPAAVVAVISATPGSAGMTTMSLGELPWDKTLFWRMYATDGTTTSPFSAVVSFKTAAPPPPPQPPTPPPGPSPPPGPVPPPAPGPPPPGGGVGPPRTISIDEALQIIRSVHDTEGWNLGSRSTREQRVQFLHRAVATIHYGHSRFNPRGPDSMWCVKDAGGGRPPSDDVIVRCDSREAWDLVGSSGADGYSFHTDHIGRLPPEQNVYPPPRSSLP